ncbi:hypothetical protein ZIOFF_044649 [Zingiber officinale]|uniref:phospholipase A2 n=1 Tax=Zingiber officinale TaxID=94328 RepID=A0A8J5G1I9_ZINOF|nr:hypothetical protein ZIOFF_044649 [Zingiber officinale]
MKLSVSFSRLFVLLLLLLSHINLYSVNALNVGMQFANAAIDKVNLSYSSILHEVAARVLFPSEMKQCSVSSSSFFFLFSFLVPQSVRQCSRTCESQHCTVLPFLRYGKYCGILYTGCPGEKPCDALDACCMVHDDCIGSKNNDYLDEECNGQMVECIEKVKASGAGQATFKGNQCSVEEVADLVEALLEAALLARRVIHNP